MKKELIVTAVAMLSFLLCACSHEGKRYEHVYRVYITAPEKVENVSVKYYSGKIKAMDDISLAFKTPGEISEILVKEGDYVRKGQLLASLDDADYRLGIEALQIQYDQLSKEVERLERLHAVQSITSNDYEKATSGLQQLGVQLDLNKRKLDYTDLYAPADGYIKTVNFSRGEMVDAGMPVCELIDVSGLKVEVDIPVSEFERRSSFAKYTCIIPRVQMKKTNLDLIGMSPEADVNQLHSMTFLLDDRNSDIFSLGMNVRVSIESKERNGSNGYYLPVTAVFYEDGKEYVWTVESDSTVVKKHVTVSRNCMEGKAVVTGGLSGGERIVRAGTSFLKEGEKVVVLPEMSETNIGGLL